MTNTCKLHFTITCYVHDECADDLGKDLVKFLEESWFNGEDVLEVEYIDHEVLF